MSSHLTIEAALAKGAELAPSLALKAGLRRELQAEVEAFLAAGGQIRSVAIDTPTVPLMRTMTVSSKTISDGKPRRGRPRKQQEGA